MNVVKAGVNVTKKGFHKVQPVLKKVKPIINPRNALLGFIFMSFMQPTFALAAPNLLATMSPFEALKAGVEGIEHLKF